LTALENRFSALEHRFSAIETRLEAMERRYTAQEDRMSAMMLALIVRIAERLDGGKPMIQEGSPSAFAAANG